MAAAIIFLSFVSSSKGWLQKINYLIQFGRSAKAKELLSNQEYLVSVMMLLFMLHFTVISAELFISKAYGVSDSDNLQLLVGFCNPTCTYYCNAANFYIGPRG